MIDSRIRAEKNILDNPRASCSASKEGNAQNRKLWGLDKGTQEPSERALSVQILNNLSNKIDKVAFDYDPMHKINMSPHWYKQKNWIYKQMAENR